MAYLVPYVGYEGPRRKHPAIIERERQAKIATRKNLPNHFPRRPIEFDDAPAPVLSFAGAENIPPSLRRIMVEVCKEHNVTPADLIGVDHRKHIVQARRVYCIRAKEETMCSYTKIARSINKDHTSVIYFVKQGHGGCSMKPVKQQTDIPSYAKPRPPVTELTELELEYVALEAEGLKTAEIAQRMGKSKEAVGHYRKRVNKKRQLKIEMEQGQ